MRGSLLVRRSLSVVVVFTALLAAEGEIRNTVVAQDQKDRPAVLVNPRAIGGSTARTQAVAVAPACGVGAERLDVLANDGVEHKGRRVPQGVLGDGHAATGAGGMPRRPGGGGMCGTAVGRASVKVLRSRRT